MRTVLRYHGGKYQLAPWIIEHFPPHRVYVEPFGGAASVLMRKPRSYAEIYNDLDDEVVNVFQVLRDPERAKELELMLRLTPFARTEFEQAYTSTVDPVERARCTIIKSFMGFGSDAIHTLSGFRANSNRSGTTPAHDWASYPTHLKAFRERLQGVVIESREASKTILQHDSPRTLHYVDPPYVMDTREGRPRYRYEMTDDDHQRIAAVLRNCKGMVVISGYACDLYDVEMYPDWTRVERNVFADGARPRIEVLWMNRACQLPLFKALP